ncbi:DUF6338 family protein [Microbulbifer thermotolerans]|uniref:DUF6338 family protein n=1 Tax=Microbulbifer thermotolerans TaxID=252514 RepID=A0AB35I0R2_MICTH|nr:DUF6338 family protein [Microbulbifer thermotolerans]MCX2781528.1 DUF6338 family protein [Microbulbifer thermotolerans]MCX2794685.1 DUF6338 family protein [Microbulbifer thermotolerans]MCX2803353.1 DUF6338 family protein [Microbulbifer thermotolerans]SFC70646.1 hypothetical protein SAMN05660479_02226 [Microbulbifer thermotolerans]
MNIWEEDKLLVFIAFVIPGFVAIKAYELFFPSQRMDSSKQVVDAVAYSCFNYSVLIWPIYLVEHYDLQSKYPFAYGAFYFFVFFIAPVFWVYLWKKIRQTEYFQKLVPHPTQKPWDFVFGQRKAYWVIVNLKNGEKVAGMYGPNSFASSAPADEQIYLEQLWVLNEDDGFERPAEQTAGVIILSSEIKSIELIHSGEQLDDREED